MLIPPLPDELIKANHPIRAINYIVDRIDTGTLSK